MIPIPAVHAPSIAATFVQNPEAMSNATTLRLYRTILRLGRKWEALDPTATATERRFIQGEAKTLFRANKKVSRGTERKEERSGNSAVSLCLQLLRPIFLSCRCTFLTCPNFRCLIQQHCRHAIARQRSVLSWVRCGEISAEQHSSSTLRGHMLLIDYCPSFSQPHSSPLSQSVPPNGMWGLCFFSGRTS